MSPILQREILFIIMAVSQKIHGMDHDIQRSTKATLQGQKDMMYAKARSKHHNQQELRLALGSTHEYLNISCMFDN